MPYLPLTLSILGLVSVLLALMVGFVIGSGRQR